MSFKLYFSRFRALIMRDPALVVLLVLAASYFLLYYVANPARPAGIFTGFLGFEDKALYPVGWFGFYDQGQYLRLAHTLAGLDFGRLHEVYTYGLGYPLVAVPFLWLGFDKDPFVFFNFIAFVFAAFATYKAAKYFISPLAGWLAGFGLVFATPLIDYTDIPWNSTVCLFAVSGILLVATAKKVNKWHALAVGLLIGWAFAARYVDVLWLGVLGTASLYRDSFKDLVKNGLVMAVGVGLLAAPVMYSHQKVFGSPLRTPYVNHASKDNPASSDQSLDAYKLERIPNSALGAFGSPRLAGSDDQGKGLLMDMFWIVAAIPGAIILIRKTKYKLFVGTLVGITVVAFLFYLSYRSGTPEAIKYGALHYLKMFWPGLVILAVAFFDDRLTKVMKPPARKKV